MGPFTPGLILLSQG